MDTVSIVAGAAPLGTANPSAPSANLQESMAESEEALKGNSSGSPQDPLFGALTTLTDAPVRGGATTGVIKADGETGSTTPALANRQAAEAIATRADRGPSSATVPRLDGREAAPASAPDSPLRDGRTLPSTPATEPTTKRQSTAPTAHYAANSSERITKGQVDPALSTERGRAAPPPAEPGALAAVRPAETRQPALPAPPEMRSVTAITSPMAWNASTTTASTGTAAPTEGGREDGAEINARSRVAIYAPDQRLSTPQAMPPTGTGTTPTPTVPPGISAVPEAAASPNGAFRAAEVFGQGGKTTRTTPASETRASANGNSRDSAHGDELAPPTRLGATPLEQRAPAFPAEPVPTMARDKTVRRLEARLPSALQGQDSAFSGATNAVGSQGGGTAATAATPRPSFTQAMADGTAHRTSVEAMHVHKLADGRVEVQLEPPELGRVEIAFDFGEDGLRATLASDRPGTAELVRRHADMLLQQLRAAGFENATLDFGGHAKDGRTQDQSASFRREDNVAPALSSAAEHSAQRTTTRNLDLRL
ncbi:MAG: flagellar hook-length control protein FliK [Pseudomonadota bacterium]